MKGHSAIAQALLDNGVDVAFGLIGDGNMHYIADFAQLGGRFIGTAVEGNATSMADGYSRMTGKVGVVSTTHGPAATNCVTALTEAARASSPVVLITGEPIAKRGFAQQIDLAGVFSATGAYYHRVISPEHLIDDIAIILARAAASRKPAVLDISYTFVHENYDYAPSKFKAFRPDFGAAGADMIDEGLGALGSARRPIILAGRGAVRSGARQELVELADRLGAPLMTTAGAKDLFMGHPYNLGIMGTVSTPYASEVLSKADCLAVFGASLTRHTTLDGELTAGRRIIQCDSTPANIGRYFPVDAAMHGDVKATVTEMNRMLDEASLSGGSFRVTQMGDGILNRDPRSDFLDRGTETTLDPRTAMIRLDELLPPDRVVVSDVGRFVAAPWNYLHVQSARDFTQTGSFASIGLGGVAAIGAAVATPGRLTVGVSGDGGMMMGLIEMSTAARNHIPLLMVVLNDNAYGSEYSRFEALGYDPKLCYVDWPDFADVARSLGCDGATVRTISELEAAVADVTNLERPLLLDIRIDPTVNPHLS